MAFFSVLRSAAATVLVSLALANGASAASCASGDNYDFVIVGGGTAGLALGTRLSQRLPNQCILVIEAGEAALQEPKINVPGMKGSTLGTKYDWNFTTTPQAASSGRVFAQNRGKVLGGSSALNLMTWDRSTVPEYDGWEKLGNSGWNWPNMIAAMEKVENFTNTGEYDASNAGMGSSGPIKTVINRVKPAQQDYWLPTMNNLGIPTNPLNMDGNNLGVMNQTSNIDPTNYTRSYTPIAYWPQAGPNLQVRTNTTVAKVNFQTYTNGRPMSASGVTLLDGSVINAKNEVILSAGSIQSPAILERSGVGNKTVLAAAGVQTLLDLPSVGENLQDHLRIQSSYTLKSNYTSFDQLRFNTSYATAQYALYNQSKYSEYDYTGSGYSYQTWAQLLGNGTAPGDDSTLINLAKQVANTSNVVDQQKLTYLIGSNVTRVPQAEVIFSDGYTGVKGYPIANNSQYGIQTFSLISIIMHPFSKGSVHINTTSIYSSTGAAVPGGLAKPVINPNYMSNEYDIQGLIAIAKNNRRIAQTYPLSQAWDSEYEPGLNVTRTDAQWRDYVLKNALTIYHPLGTTAMLPKAFGGVVDPTLKVYDTAQLRVVDAGIIPILISAHIQTAVLGIAERAADMIVAEWSDGTIGF